MKITPLDIQHKAFDTQWRGYHKTQVDQFLEEIAESVEELTKDNLVLKEKFSGKDEELGQLKRAESTLDQHASFRPNPLSINSSMEPNGMPILW